jgi:four helix bundle protein
MNIALKEANETLYWIDLLHQSDYLTAKAVHQYPPRSRRTRQTTGLHRQN